MPLDSDLFRLPFCPLAIPKLLCDFAVQFLLICLIRTATNRTNFTFETYTYVPRLPLNVLLCLLKCRFDCTYHLIRDVNVSEDVRHTSSNFLFAETRQIAWPPVTAAAVVHVLAFLHFSRDRAAVVCAREHLFKGDLMFAVFPFTPAPQKLLHVLVRPH